LPFKGKDKSIKLVAAFSDTWTWGEEQQETYKRFWSGPHTKPIAQLIEIAKTLEKPTIEHRLDAYLVNMAKRLIGHKKSIIKKLSYC